MRRVTLSLLSAVLLLTAGCFSWTEDQNGNLQSVGLPGVPVWQSKAPPPEVTPASVGFLPDEAAKMGGPVLVEPNDNGPWRYHFYQADQNHCDDDLKKLLAARPANSPADTMPYCSLHPTQAPIKGHALLF